MHANRNKKAVKRVEKGMMKANRIRNLFAVFAIVLTTFMITTVFSLGINYMENMKLMQVRTAGTTATVTIQAKLDKANSRLTNLIAMRADGEISKDEYQAMRSPVDEEIKKLQKALDEIPQEKSNPKGLDIEGIRSTLNSFIDFSGSTISHDVVNQFVYLITPTSDTTFDWYVNLNGTADVKATFTAEGRKKNCIIKLEEIEKISSVHREKNEDNAHFIKNPHIFTYLHRQLSLRRMHN